MEDAARSQAGAVLRVLADLAPAAEQLNSKLTVPTEWFRWLPAGSVRLFSGPHAGATASGVAGLTQAYVGANTAQLSAVTIERHFGERLAAVDQIRPGERLLRAGWLFVAGRMTTDDRRARRVFHPLVRIPVRVQRLARPGGVHLLPAGDVEISELVADHDVRHQLESSVEFGGGALEGLSEIEIPSTLLRRLDRLRHCARILAHAAGLPATDVVSATDGPDGFMRSHELVIVAGVGVYAIREVGESSRASSLRAWADAPLDTWTAFHSLYLDPADVPRSQPVPDETIESSFLLTPTQRRAISTSRREPITLISGAPGTGKSHTIAAVACDTLARGERVLVTAKSDATVDALLDLFERVPGADPVVFGSNERREALATRLSAGQLQPETEVTVASAAVISDAIRARRDALHAQVVDRLSAEILLDAAEGTTESRAVAPELFEPDTDYVVIRTLIEAAAAPGDRWRARRRRRKAQRRLVRATGAPSIVTVEEIRAAFTVARAVRAANQLQALGGLELGPLWAELLAADDESRVARGKWLAADSRSEDRLNGTTLRAVAALATALRSGRSARRAQLSRLDDDKLTRALPLWVGTLADVDDLLPPVAGLFDLVILDEASAIDQPLAATALLRGCRAVIAGDPRQLRQVSFVSDAQLRAAVTTRGLDEAPILAARLDVRRNSTFDLAAGATSVLVLSEHFRSDPHLVDFVARRLYDGKVLVATRSPTTESRRCLEVVRLDGRRDDNGVIEAEVEQTVTELRALLRAGVASVGVVTPFRAQADAIEEAALAAFSADDIEALDLRVGTVHAFQGNERDVVIASMGIGPEENASSWRFVEDPHLFAVFMTRARRRQLILVSADPPDGGLVMAYLAQADHPPGPPKSAGTVGPWATSIVEDLISASVPIVVAYPTGRHIVDICFLDESRNLGIECQVHSDGPEAHIERHLALSRRGWEFVEAYQSRWGERRAELIVELAGLLRSN